LALFFQSISIQAHFGTPQWTGNQMRF